MTDKEKINEDLEKASKEYFDKIVEETKCHFNHYMTYAQGFEEGRLRVKDAFVAGANWNKEKIINKACEWLENNLSDKTSVLCSGVVSINFDNVLKDFRKAMEAEK